MTINSIKTFKDSKVAIKSTRGAGCIWGIPGGETPCYYSVKMRDTINSTISSL